VLIGVVVLSTEDYDTSEELYWESVYARGGVGKHEKENAMSEAEYLIL